MDPFYFLKLWKPNIKDHPPRPSSGGHSDTTAAAAEILTTAAPDDDYNLDEEEDSFFELELTVSDSDNTNNNNKCKNTNTVSHADSNRFGSKDHNFCKFPNLAGNSECEITRPVVSSDHNNNTNLVPSKRKILPIEPTSNKHPQSAVSAPKSAPRFRVLMFKKSKSMAARETEFLDASKNSAQKQESKLFTIKFKLKEVPILKRDNSLRNQISDDSLSNESSKRFSKQVIQKYLKLIKPLSIKVSKKQTVKPPISGELLPVPSPASSPATLPSCSPKKEKQGSIPAGIRKHFVKSKSASSNAVAPPPTVSRRDDSLLLQHDGIQSAILHCKKSFNSSSTDCSLLSRFASDPLQEKSMASPRSSHEQN